MATVVKSTVDDDLKEQATELYSRLGMSISTAINVFLRQSVMEGGMPFTPRDPFYSEENLRHVRESVAQFDNGEFSERELVDAE